MIVAGVMSGTSADGIDVALVQVGARGRHSRTNLELLGHAAFPYPARVRRSVLGAMNSSSASVADLARLNVLLGERYAEAVIAAQKKFRVQAELIGCHGQTLYHQGKAAPFLGRKIATTWQTGEAAVIAARTGLPVVSDFRPADMAVGGQGAPLVPYLDYFLYGDARVGRIAQNIGGIANLTAIPAGASLDRVMAFDTGPGNMVIDALTEKLFGRPFDGDGQIAARGRVIEPVIAQFLAHRFFRRPPPKTAGREEFGREFGREFAQEFLRRHRESRRSKATKGGTPGMSNFDAVATATALTARSISQAVRRFVLSRGKFSEMIVSGGGAKNSTLMAMLASELSAMGLRLRGSGDFGIPPAAKEAVAFALLAFETWHRRPSNVPSATGARKAVVLGKVSYP